MSSVRACNPVKPCSRPGGKVCQPTSPMPSGSNRRGRKYRVSGIPALRWMMLANVYVHGWLYANTVPGGRSGGMSRKPRTGSFESRATAWLQVSCSWPLAIAAICRMHIEGLPPSVMSASNSGKCETTVSSRSSRPSAAAKAAAVEVNDLLSEYRRWGLSALKGRHQPSATTCPCRTSMMLCISMSGRASSASRNARTPAGSTCCSAGELRGNDAGTSASLKDHRAPVPQRTQRPCSGHEAGQAVRLAGPQGPGERAGHVMKKKDCFAQRAVVAGVEHLGERRCAQKNQLQTLGSQVLSIVGDGQVRVS